MQSAAKSNLKRVSLELGGKSPLVVFPDVDCNYTLINLFIGFFNQFYVYYVITVDEAVTISYNAIFANMGQCCCAGSRTFVHADIYDAFVQKAAALASKRKVGNPFDEGVEQGPQVIL